ncbi:WhiB family transcriptional regulator [Gordonia sp. HY442]|uniref:WhiB family transcriptional regulator n=1 Tax=Gordonia zhenghanii TaxID=2911516 RepID=UPI001F258443|nr:WhiB family transcriptional regulator [Gordonia zhenghanii]MCF8603264.1 WhiB family transcriptional regulator [Gordonia zhenghanii]
MTAADSGTLDLLARILDGLPNLSGAACVGREVLFDPYDRDEPIDLAEYRHARALALCNECPVRSACAEHVHNQRGDTARRARRAVIGGRAPRLTQQKENP